MSKTSRDNRKKLLEKGAMLKYFKYASGEIILVMIGILLAVQVNNWNEERIQKDEVSIIIGNLENEFIQNKENIQLKIKDLNTSFQNAKNLIKLVGKKDAELNRYNTDSLLAISFRNKRYNPSEDVISSLIGSGRFKLLKKDAIKNFLFQWSSNRTERSEHFYKLDDNTSKVFSYLTHNYSLKNFDLYNPEKLTEGSNLPTNRNVIFQDIVFENHLQNHIYYTHRYIKILKETEEIIDRIINFTKNHQK